MKKFFSLITLSILFLTFFTPNVSAQSFEVLHDFRDTVLNGANPYYGPLLLRSGKFYGTTQVGGANSQGVIFSVDTDGTDFEVIHDFAQTGTNGAQPRGGVITDGTKLYGMTFAGGVDGDGVVYSVDLDGSNFEVLRSFTDGDAGDGMEPTGGLILSGGRLYGMTAHGGANGEGIVFVIDTDGTDFEILRSFGSGGTDGLNPIGALVIDGSFLYGMTSEGGANGDGTVFRITTAGGSYSVLHSFDGTDGDTPYGSLVVSGGTLYGMATLGGNSAYGVVFSLGLTGSNFSVLHHFNGTNGANPYGAFVLRNSVLYGTTYNGGSDGQGTVFSIDTDGTDFEVLHNFASSTLEGEGPYSTLTLDDSGNLYGTTFEGGEYDDGIIFSVSNPDPTPTPTPGGGGGGGSGGGGGGVGSCTASIPQGVPNLFQINTTRTTATLYFTPVLGATNYLISYGYGADAPQYSVFTNQGFSSGVLSYTINAIPPNTTFSYQVAAFNGCMPGSFGNTMTVKTTSPGTSNYYQN